MKKASKFQNLVCRGKYNGSTEETAEEIFQRWLSMQMLAVRCRNTPFHELEEFVWTWEVCCLHPLVWYYNFTPCPSLYINLLCTLRGMNVSLFLTTYLIIFLHQVEEEFRDYIPAYIDMLHQVDEMDDCLEVNYLLSQYFTLKFNSFSEQLYTRVLVIGWLYLCDWSGESMVVACQCLFLHHENAKACILVYW